MHELGMYLHLILAVVTMNKNSVPMDIEELARLAREVCVERSFTLEANKKTVAELNNNNFSKAVLRVIPVSNMPRELLNRMKGFIR